MIFNLESEVRIRLTKENLSKSTEIIYENYIHNDFLKLLPTNFKTGILRYYNVANATNKMFDNLKLLKSLLTKIGFDVKCDKNELVIYDFDEERLPEGSHTITKLFENFKDIMEDYSSITISNNNKNVLPSKRYVGYIVLNKKLYKTINKVEVKYIKREEVVSNENFIRSNY